MSDAATSAPRLPPDQRALRARCAHPSGRFVTFPPEALEQSVAHRFETIVRRHPDRLAVRTREGGPLTYAALNRAANRIARAILAARGESPEPVGVLMGPGADIVAAILAVLKTGKIYVPLDPALAPARATHILEDTEAGLILTHARHLAEVAAIRHGHDALDVDAIDVGGPADDLGLSIPPDRLAYVLYTSGSAGAPKGVVQDHRNLLHQIKRETNGLHICAEDRLILVRSCGAIGGVRIVLSALLNGASVHPVNPAVEGRAGLVDVLREDGITIYDSTPTTFRHFAGGLTGAERFPALRLIRLSSEPASSRDVELYQRHFAPPCILVNSLGLTEAGGSVRHYFVDERTRAPDGTLPVGYAVEDTEVLLLDDHGREVGAGGTGEIAVRSRYLPPGYWRRPDLTGTKFLPDPRGGDARLYRTGDLGRVGPDGCLMHVGRKDAHVKIRGSFVDVAEIERRLRALEPVSEAVVLARGDRPDERRLVAYVVVGRSPAPTVSNLRRALSETLPDSMIPSAFVMLPALPVTPTGKVDRDALPAPGRARPDLDTTFVAPGTALEKTLADIWADVLAVDRVGVQDNFFDLGGHSLSMADVHARVREALGRDVALVDMFAHPTISSLAGSLGPVAAETPGITAALDRARKHREMLARLAPPPRP